MDTDSQRLIHTETGGQNGGSAATPPQTKPGRKKATSAGSASKRKSASKSKQRKPKQLGAKKESIRMQSVSEAVQVKPND